MTIEQKVSTVLKYFKSNLSVAINPKDFEDLLKRIPQRPELCLGYPNLSPNDVTFEGYKIFSACWVKEGEVKIHFGDENAN